jgi:cysteine-S-conjugate beta-lyase
VKLSGGPAFGPGGEGFARLNFATSGPMLDEILARLTTALSHR